MNPQEIQAALQTGKPFLLRATDGKDLPITEPDQIAFPPGAPYIIVHDLHRKGGSFEIVSLDTVSAIEIVP
jgi:hypothetical protein